MWNPTDQLQQDQEDDSWEVRAFAEDTSNIMGTTWPPRSYTCTFCRREFRSAQALGGHMNVHRRDRARLHQASPNNVNPISSLSHTHPSPSFLSHSQDLVANAGMRLLYALPSPSSVPFSSLSHHTALSNACVDSVSSHSHPSHNLMRNMPTCSTTSFDFSVPHPAAGINVFSSYSAKVEEQQPTTSSTNHARHEDLDLELRLGNRST